MTWNAFHHRGDVLQTVVDTADQRRDGLLPMLLPGVTETFKDELDLVAALHLKWHTRLSANVERALMTEPLDLADAVASAWRLTSQEMPGIRMILDRYTEFPSGPEMATALTKAHEKEWTALAVAAGLASDESASAARAGKRVETLGRVLPGSAVAVAASATMTTTSPSVGLNDEVSDELESPSLVERIKAVLAA